MGNGPAEVEDFRWIVRTLSVALVRLSRDRHLDQLGVLYLLRDRFARGDQVLEVEGDRLLGASPALVDRLTLYPPSLGPKFAEDTLETAGIARFRDDLFSKQGETIRLTTVT